MYFRRNRPADDARDEELVQDCLNGQTGAFEVLVDRYQKVLFNLALRIVGRVPDAEDVTQTVFLKAYDHLASFNPDYKFYSWIYRMTVNEALNAAKRKHPDAGVPPDTASDLPTPEEAFRATSITEGVREALRRLNPQDRAIITLKHLEGHSYEEIADMLGIEPKTVKSRLYTARQRLRDILFQSEFREL